MEVGQYVKTPDGYGRVVEIIPAVRNRVDIIAVLLDTGGIWIGNQERLAIIWTREDDTLSIGECFMPY